MPEYSLTVTDHDQEQLWLVVDSEHRTVTLEDGENFFSWAHQRWPSPRWNVELDPGQLSAPRPR